MTLNDLERPIGRHYAIFHIGSKRRQIRILSATKIQQNESGIDNMRCMVTGWGRCAFISAIAELVIK